MNVQLLRSSFELVTAREPALIAHFYEILFTRYPATQRLFGRNASAAQEKMLAGAVAAVLDHIEDAAWFTSTLIALGAKHANYGVTDEMYGWVGECFLAALAKAAGKDWSDELAAAWTAAYAAISGTMIAGARASATVDAA